MRNYIATSIDAYKSIKGDAKENHNVKIVQALSVLKSATYEEIASHLKWDDKNRAARRLSELEREQMVYKPGEKKKTRSGRDAYVYRLVSSAEKHAQRQLF
jgi:predicted transcriptional regulator